MDVAGDMGLKCCPRCVSLAWAVTRVQKVRLRSCEVVLEVRKVRCAWPGRMGYVRL